MTDSCLFCDIVAGEVPATLVHDSEHVVAFRDINPQAPTHVLIVPRAHHVDVATLAADNPELLGEVVREAAVVAAKEGVAERGWRLVFNVGSDAGQTVLHIHGHVLGGRGLGWPPG
jgi:histidine triad (HIT) family protein